MSYQVFLTDDEACDLEDLYDYIESHYAPEKAEYVLDKIKETFSSLIVLSIELLHRMSMSW
ncbi:hypothetical protein [Alkalimarinus coralli]|uniref:hypothetical protein n=1 Tax=Alkalimarinus coralli TaxID=2935863 RepID=UPI00202AF8DD|nr:hypothetical protein [Alkalimarinus coralli]